MCGIAGLIDASGLAPEWHVDLRLLSRAVQHRGPDDNGYFTDINEGESPGRFETHPASAGSPRVAFAHQRLSILDLNAAARQPMIRGGGRVFVTYNGEIYNFRELRGELEREGSRFQTQSDTEVLLEGYLRWGQEVVRRLRGIFAFALADMTIGKVFLVRDHLGVKPLYVTRQRSRWVFASELKAIAALPSLSREIDPQALRKYLRYLWIPGAHTGIRNVMKLLPGTITEIDLASGEQRSHEYWSPFVYAETRIATPDAVAHTRVELRRAVAEQMVSDVPVGAFLSGGLDSSLVVALMKQASGSSPSTYSVGYTQRDLAYDVVPDDLPFAREVSRLFGTTSTEIVLEPDVASLLPTIVETLDEPIGDPAAISSYLISKAAKKTLTVMLSGVGGDELFGGYPRQRALLYGSYFRALPRFFRDQASALADRIPAAGKGTLARLGRACQKFFNSANADALSHYVSMESYFGDDLQAELLGHDGPIATAIDPALAETLELRRRVAGATDDLLKQALLWDLVTYLPNLNLAYTDRTSMAHGIEVRVPLLDVRLVEWALSLPSDQLIRWRGTKLEGKWLLKQAARSILPDRIVFRRKSGFGSPIRAWLRNDLAEMRTELLGSRGLVGRGWFNPRALQRLEQDFIRGHRDYSLHLWMLMSLELWARRFIDRHPAAA